MRSEAVARFSPSEKAKILKLARAVMPGNATIPGADERCVERTEKFLGESPGLLRGWRAMLGAFEASARLYHFGRSFGSLSDTEVFALAERWRTGDYARRTMLRVLLMPLKALHYDGNAQLFKATGCKPLSLATQNEEQPRWMTERVTDLHDLGGDEELECDAVVVGTGAGGAVVAKELAEKGLAVVLLEEGRYHSRTEFTGRALESNRKLYRDMGATLAVGNVGIPIPVGRAVGGTTLVNSGTCYRAPSRVLAEWQHSTGIPFEEELAPAYERVEHILGVAPALPQHYGGVGRIIARGCDALGFAHGPLRRNAPDCDGQGVCCFGCPTDAKRSTNVSYVPMALKAGANLFTSAKVDDILVENGRAIGVRARAGGHTLTVKARAVVIGAGSLLTPVLLERNKLAGSSGWLGRNLTIHPATVAIGYFDEILDGQNSIPQGYAIEQFHDEGLLFEGAFTPPDVAAAGLGYIGPALLEMLERYRHLACFGFMLEETSRGRVRSGPGGRPLITYWLNDHDVARIKRGLEILCRVYFAAGARAVLPNIHGFDRFESLADLEKLRRAKLVARDFDLSAYHPLGTARMGRDPSSSVVDENQQVHDMPGLYIADASVLPTSPAVNPQMTIMALSTRASERLARTLS
jgi:choline dehydrogenase-like flavoprotein